MPSAGAGRYVVQWDGHGARGGQMPPGIYFLILEAGGFHQAQRVVVMK